jgi:hypothetical protein
MTLFGRELLRFAVAAAVILAWAVALLVWR